MRLKHFISEKTTEKDQADAAEVEKIIKQDCKPFIKESKGGLLYRGVKLSKLNNNIIVKIKPRTNRKALDTPRGIQEYADLYFKHKFKWKPRSEGVFCTGKINTAANYGFPVTVWPIGTFKFVWSPDIKDFYRNFIEIYDELALQHKGLVLDDPEYYLSMDYIEGIFETELEQSLKTYKDTNLTQAIQSNNEIMLGCKEYYITPAHFSEHFKEIK